MNKLMLLTILPLASLAAFAALVHTSSLENGLVVLQINTTQNQVAITNNDPSRAAVFNVFDAATGTQIVWSYTQPPNSSATIAIPTTDNNSNPINWQIGTVTTKSGQQVQTIMSPPWQVTMQ